MAHNAQSNSGVENVIASTVEQNASSASSLLTESTTRRKNVSIACLGCRRGKAKCEGTQPCARCVEKRLECQYPSDGRDRTLLKRKLEQVEHEKNLLNDLLTSLRDAQDSQVMSIISLIRADASLDEIHTQLMQMSQDARRKHREVRPDIKLMLDTTEVAISEAHPRDTIAKGQDRLRVRHLVDQPPIQVSAHPWTDITTDDHLASHLVSLWAAWTHPWPDGVVLDFFLRDMRAGDRDGLFCSSSLVELILAMGCILSDYPEARMQQGRHSSIIDTAIDRFESYLSKEEGLQLKITTVQALMLLHVLLGCIGRDRRATQCLSQGVQLCNELLRDRQKVIKARPDEESRHETSYVIDVLGWHVLGLSTKVSIGLMQPQPMRLPTRPFPQHQTPVLSVPAGVLSAYDRIGQTLDTSLEETLPYHADLAVLEHELLGIRAHIPTKNRHPYDNKLEVLLDLDARLVVWHDRLPHQFREPTRLATPVAFLRWWWLADRMTILTSIRAELIKNDNVHDQLFEHGLGGSAVPGIAVGERIPSSARIDHVQSCLEALAVECVRFSRMFRTYYARDKLHTFMGHPIHQALYILLFQNVDQKYDDEITELITTLHTQGRRMPCIISVLRMIEVDCGRHKLHLPTAARDLLPSFNEGDTEQGEAASVQVLSVYPNLVSVEQCLSDHKAEKLPLSADEFLKAFGDLRVRDEQSTTKQGRHIEPESVEGGVKT